MKGVVKSWITVKNSTMVKPAEETPRRNLWLSSLDWMVLHPYRHTAVMMIYPASDHDNVYSSEFFDVDIMKTSLSRALVPFYPMAGRLKRNNERLLEIDCNAEGALFVEAEAKKSLAEFGAVTPDVEPRKWFVPYCGYSKGLSSFPLLILQLTRFSCGSVVLGFAQHHQIGDGTAHMDFVTTWARFARGLDLNIFPCHDRAPYLNPRDPPQISFPHFSSEYGPPQGLIGDDPKLIKLDETAPTTISAFKLTKDQVYALKEKAISTLSQVQSEYKLTTYEVLSAHVWRCACKARELAQDQEVKLIIPTNGRPRLKQPPLPQGFCANVTFYPACIAKASEITCNPLGYVASKIHETIMRVSDEEYLRSTIDYLESHPEKETLIRSQQKLMCPNLHVNSWARFPYDESDFGWGKPVHAGPGGIAFEGQAIITANVTGDGGLIVSIKLFAIHMTSFERCFYDF